MLTQFLGWLGIFAPMVLGSIGSIVGCALAGRAAVGAMMETDTGHGRYVGASVLPSSQSIYGIVTMFGLNRPVDAETAPGLAAIGLLVGGALLVSGIYQGLACASGIQASKSKPEVFGLSMAPAAVVEGFAVFVFVFALVLSADLPGGTG